jgi:hypothetical protein
MKLLATAAAVLLLHCGHTAIAQPAPDRMPTAAPPIDVEQAMNAGPRGTLAVRAVQGTKGGPAVGVCDVQVELVHRNQVIKRVDAKLDENGMVLVRDLPVAMPIRPVVRVKYDNVMYQDVGPQMDASNLTASVEVTVYQTTDQAPQWRVKERQIMVAPAAGGVQINESTVVVNPGDKTWLGAPPDAQDRRTVVVLTLPEGAQDVHLDAGFHGWCCTSFTGRTLAVQMPLMPGSVSYHYSYRVPAASGAAAALVGAPVVCDSLLFALPEHGIDAVPTKLESSGTQTIQGAAFRVFGASNIQPGLLAGLTCTNLPSVQPVASSTPRPVSSSWLVTSTPLLVTLGVGVLIVGGAVLIWLRPPGDQTKPS